ncbi:MAG: metallophosphoesterase, partial [Candidatus Solibacter sp.]|nr:metallophosphoesterase [Candidatus Solibacter sp.]
SPFTKSERPFLVMPKKAGREAAGDEAAGSESEGDKKDEGGGGFRAPGDAATLPELIRFMIDRTGYIKALETDGSPEAFSRIENLKELANAAATDWKVCYFHHPLYSSAAFHGSSTELRMVLEPLFVKYGVRVVFSGHNHVYERVKPQKGIYYFTEGASGSLRPGDLRKTALTAVGYDRERSFMAVEISAEELFFQTISRTGMTVDSGSIRRTGDDAPAVPQAPAVRP